MEELEEAGGRPNKSAQKRERAERAQLIDRISQLSEAELRRLETADDIVGLMAELRAIKPSGARNRQLKYCVKCLEGVDLQFLQTYLDDRHSQQLQLNQVFHELEQWRDQLIEQGDQVMQQAVDRWPHLERQRLRQLVREARRERELGKPAGAGRRLFRYLRELQEQTGAAQ